MPAAQPEQLAVRRQHRRRIGVLGRDVARLDVGAIRSHGRAGREPAVRAAATPRHRRSRLVAVPPRDEPPDQATAALGRRVDDLVPRHRHVARPDLLAVVEERRAAQGQAQDRGRAGDLVAGRRVGVRARAATPGATGRGSRARSSATPSSPNRSSCFWLASAKPSAFQCWRISSKSKTRWRGALSLRRQRRIAREELPDRHPSRERIDERPELRQEAGQLGPVLVVEVDLAVVRAAADAGGAGWTAAARP